MNCLTSYIPAIIDSTEDSQAEFVEKFPSGVDKALMLKDKWTFWEQYEALGVTKNEMSNAYLSNMSKVACFNDVITFWQIWNNLPVSDVTKLFFNYDHNTIPR